MDKAPVVEQPHHAGNIRNARMHPNFSCKQLRRKLRFTVGPNYFYRDPLLTIGMSVCRGPDLAHPAFEYVFFKLVAVIGAESKPREIYKVATLGIDRIALVRAWT